MQFESGSMTFETDDVLFQQNKKSPIEMRLNSMCQTASAFYLKKQKKKNTQNNQSKIKLDTSKDWRQTEMNSTILRAIDFGRHKVNN